MCIVGARRPDAKTGQKHDVIGHNWPDSAIGVSHDGAGCFWLTLGM
jgi:hypothetical protein